MHKDAGLALIAILACGSIAAAADARKPGSSAVLAKPGARPSAVVSTVSRTSKLPSLLKAKLPSLLKAMSTSHSGAIRNREILASHRISTLATHPSLNPSSAKPGSIGMRPSATIVVQAQARMNFSQSSLANQRNTKIALASAAAGNLKPSAHGGFLSTRTNLHPMTPSKVRSASRAEFSPKARGTITTLRRVSPRH
jgi:hypothetical protein